MNAPKQNRFKIQGRKGAEEFYQLLLILVESGRKPFVEILEEKRTVDQNALLYALYTEIARVKGDESIAEIRRYCKLHHGVPILLGSNEEFAYVYNRAIRPLDYEFKLKAMDFWPVSSKMNKSQFSTYLDSIVRDYANQGYYIQMPEG